MLLIVKAGCLMLASALFLTGCDKSVVWEEEALLNTGDVIWIKRSEKYSLQGDAGNPLDLLYRPEGKGTLEFTWGGRAYSFREHGAPILLAISPQNVPIIVAQADGGSWDAMNNYACTTPFYVQFVPDSSGGRWAWPPQIETWLYGMKSNLLLAKPMPGSEITRYSMAERAAADARIHVLIPSRAEIDVEYVSDICKPKSRRSRK